MSLTRRAFFAAVALTACSSETTTTTDPEPTSCTLPVLAPAADACPATATAEAAFEDVLSSCQLALNADFDMTDPNNTAVNASGQAKLCASCDCRKATVSYWELYVNCTDPGESANASLAQNLYVAAKDNCGS